MTEDARESVFVARLRADLERHLRELDGERVSTRRAIRALRPTPNARGQQRPGLRAAILAGVSEDPGIRATMLALVVGRRPDDVTTTLRALEQEGLVRRAGLGWS